MYVHTYERTYAYLHVCVYERMYTALVLSQHALDSFTFYVTKSYWDVLETFRSQ